MKTSLLVKTVYLLFLLNSFFLKGQMLSEPVYRPGKTIISGKINNYDSQKPSNLNIRVPGLILRDDPVYFDINEDGSFTTTINLQYRVQVPLRIDDHIQYILLEPGDDSFYIDIDLQPVGNKEEMFKYKGLYAEINRDYNHRLASVCTNYYDKDILIKLYGKSPLEVRDYCMADLRNTIKENNKRDDVSEDARKLANLTYAFSILHYLTNTKWIQVYGAIMAEGITRSQAIANYIDYSLPEDYYSVLNEFPYNDPMAISCHNFREATAFGVYQLAEPAFELGDYLLENAPLADEEKEEINSFTQNIINGEEPQRGDEIMQIMNKYFDLGNVWRKENLEKSIQTLSHAFNSDSLPIFEYMETAFARLYLMDFKPLTEEKELYYSKLTNPICIGVLEDTNNKMKPRNRNKEAKHIICEQPDVPAEATLDAIINPYKGKVILIDMWASWCVGCRRAIKEYSALKEGMKEDVVFVYITDYSTPEELWHKLIPDMEGFHFRLDKEHWNYLWTCFNLYGLPYHLIIDREGNINNEFIYVPKNELKEMLEKVI